MKRTYFTNPNAPQWEVDHHRAMYFDACELADPVIDDRALARTISSYANRGLLADELTAVVLRKQGFVAGIAVALSTGREAAR